MMARTPGQRRGSDPDGLAGGVGSDGPDVPLVSPGETVAPRRRERADAARNRRRVLDTAEQVIAEHGVAALSMHALAREAGVGVGTLYRRFSDRAGLLNALLDARERDFQAAFLKGPPPLGPGAETEERIEAFLGACVDFLEQHTALSLACEGADPYMRARAASYQVRRLHLAALLRDASPGVDAEYGAAALLEALGAHHYDHQRRELGMSVTRIKAGVTQLARGLAQSSAGEAG